MLDGRRADSGGDDLVNRQRCLGDLHFVGARARRRVTRSKERAAILIRNDGNRIRAETLRLRLTLFFTAVLAVSLLAFSALLYVMLDYTLALDVDSAIASK